MKDSKTESQVRVPARRPGANSVQPLKLTKLGFSQRFQFSRLGDHMNRVQEEKRSYASATCSLCPIGVVKEKRY